jgi:hypothetical protein
MATASASRAIGHGETRFFHIMAWLMAATILAGFSLNLAMGRSSFAVPLVYHIHAVVFMSWVALYLVQNVSIDTRNVALHRRLGKTAFALVPVMLVLGFAIMIISLRRTGGPFFFDQNQFLVSNSLQLLLFGGLVFAGLWRRRHTGWHRRLLFGAMAILTGPGFGRLLPMPLLAPHAWHVAVFVPLIWPLIGMIADRRRTGTIHPAWFWMVGAVIGTQILADLIAYSPLGVALTDAVIADTPGGQRPMEALVPPGFAP